MRRGEMGMEGREKERKKGKGKEKKGERREGVDAPDFYLD